MKQPKTFLLLSIVVAVLLLGIAYAAITSVTMNITGNVGAAADQGNFDVGFDGQPSFNKTGTDTISASGTVIDRTDATLVVAGLKKVGDTVTATYTIVNNATDLKATLSLDKCALTGDDANYFNISYQFGKTELGPESSTTLTITVELVQSPLDNVTADVDISLHADPSYVS